MDIPINTQNALNEAIPSSSTHRVQIRYVIESRIDFDDSDKNETLISMEMIQYDKDEKGGWWTSYPEIIGPDSVLGHVLIENHGRLIPEVPE